MKQSILLFLAWVCCYALSAQDSTKQTDTSMLETLVISANRTVQKRKEAPIAISQISNLVIHDTKAQRLDHLLNKVSGVFMVNLGNEQHQMSIRQPMTTKSLFLYLEDGIPIRTTGVYNHNALLEMNLASTQSIEVIKGPSSALYGAEAIGGAVNIITASAPDSDVLQLSLQANNTGYKRADFKAGNSVGKWGFLVSGYAADKRNGPIEYSDFNKQVITLRTDSRPSITSTWSNTLTWMNYYSDMSGSIDSIRYARRDLSSMNSFTYRAVDALRFKSMFAHNWSAVSSTTVAAMYRNNSVRQNPSYSISSTSNPSKYKGQINENAFQSFALFANHSQAIRSLKGKLVAGASLDISPQNYQANFINVIYDLPSRKFTSYQSPDSLLSKYSTGIINMAAYCNYDWHPLKNLGVTAAVRYDAFRYYFINQLPASASVSTASTVNRFQQLTPKLGAVYNFKAVGLYANFSKGFVPPQLTELYSSVKAAPYLLPQQFASYELGGWAALHQAVYLDWSLYRMKGTNEITSVRLADNSTVNQNAGSTLHQGIEMGLNIKPAVGLSFRFSGTHARHTFLTYRVKDADFSGREMSGAPRWIYNVEASYKPAFLPGFRLSAEWQHQGRYFMDDLNLSSYAGFDVVSLRAGYRFKAFELWLNALNVLDAYYSTYASRNVGAVGSAAYAYNLGDPREITLGFCYRHGTRQNRLSFKQTSGGF